MCRAEEYQIAVLELIADLRGRGTTSVMSVKFPVPLPMISTASGKCKQEVHQIGCFRGHQSTSSCLNLTHREGLCDHPKTDVIRDPAPDRKGCNGSCHLLRPHMWKRARWRIMINKSLNEQYWSLTVYR